MDIKAEHLKEHIEEMMERAESIIVEAGVQIEIAGELKKEATRLKIKFKEELKGERYE